MFKNIDLSVKITPRLKEREALKRLGKIGGKH